MQKNVLQKFRVKKPCSVPIGCCKFIINNQYNLGHKFHHSISQSERTKKRTKKHVKSCFICNWESFVSGPVYHIL